jgi:hypothetical protein
VGPHLPRQGDQHDTDDDEFIDDEETVAAAWVPAGVAGELPAADSAGGVQEEQFLADFESKKHGVFFCVRGALTDLEFQRALVLRPALAILLQWMTDRDIGPEGTWWEMLRGRGAGLITPLPPVVWQRESESEQETDRKLSLRNKEMREQDLEPTPALKRPSSSAAENS